MCAFPLEISDNMVLAHRPARRREDLASPSGQVLPHGLLSRIVCAGTEKILCVCLYFRKKIGLYITNTSLDFLKM